MSELIFVTTENCEICNKAEKKIVQICEKLLVNLIIEDFKIDKIK